MTEYEIELNIKKLILLTTFTIIVGYILINHSSLIGGSDIKFTGNIISGSSQTYQEPEKVKDIREKLPQNITQSYLLDNVMGFDDEKLPNYITNIYYTEGKPISESEKSVERYIATYKNTKKNTSLKYTTIIFSRSEFTELSFEYKELFTSGYNSSQIQNLGYSDISKIKFRTTSAILFEKQNSKNQTIERVIVYIKEKQKITIENNAQKTEDLLILSEIEDFSKEMEKVI